MPRPPRILAEGATYHVMARGNAGLPIFEDDRDRHAFLGTFEGVVARREWTHLAHCLMSNHFHLVLTTKHADLSDGMRETLSRYARDFNQRHERNGHLFRERFRDVLIRSDRQLMAAIRYVAMNPVDAGLTSDPTCWPWSSYPVLVSGMPAPTTLAIDHVLTFFHPNPTRARQLVRKFVEEGSQVDRPTIQTLMQVLGADRAILIAQELGYLHRDIAQALGLDRSTVSHRLRRHQRRAGSRRPPPNNP